MFWALLRTHCNPHLACKMTESAPKHIYACEHKLYCFIIRHVCYSHCSGGGWGRGECVNLVPEIGGPNSDQHQFSPNKIHTLSRKMVASINQMITKEKMR